MNYIIQLSNKTEVEIDEVDFKKFTANSASGSLIKLKRGIINPSFVVAIIPSEVKAKRRVEGFIDPLTGNYVVTKDEREPYLLADSFQPEVKRLADKFKI